MTGKGWARAKKKLDRPKGKPRGGKDPKGLGEPEEVQKFIGDGQVQVKAEELIGPEGTGRSAALLETLQPDADRGPAGRQGQPMVFDEERRQDGRTVMTVNMGPQHPSTHGVLRLLVTLEGERVIASEPDIGFLHRNFEKIAENLNYPQLIIFSDRTDYLAPIHNETCCALAVEKLMGIEVPERAVYIRVILNELQRIMSHLLWFGAFGLDLGAPTPFLYGFRERERLYDIFERLTGGRLFPAFLRVGGLRNDLYDSFVQDVLDFLKYLEKEAWPEYMTLLIKNPIFQARTRNVGVISPEVAVAYGASGPVLRASGVSWDLRRDEPYMFYDRFQFQVPVGEAGDCYDRSLVRMEEMLVSAEIVRQALRQLPDGPVLARVPKVLKPEGEIYEKVESPRGEVGLYLVARGDTRPYRVKWRAPSFVHLQLLSAMSRGGGMADVVANIGSLDIILGEVDR